MANKHGLVRTIYLYLFTIIGLVLIVSGSVGFVDMFLKTYVFTKAEEMEKIQQRYYFPSPLISLERLEKYQESEELSDEEKQVITNLVEEYKEWEKEKDQVNYLAAEKHRNASRNLAMIFVGLPLYLYHWRTIKKDLKDNN